MKFGDHIIGKTDIRRRIEPDLPAIRQCKNPGAFQFPDPAICIFGVKRFGVEVQQAEHDGFGRAVADTGERQ